MGCLDLLETDLKRPKHKSRCYGEDDDLDPTDLGTLLTYERCGEFRMFRG